MRCAPSSATFTILVLSRGRGSSQLLPFIRANQGTRNIARKTVTVRGSHTFCKLQAKHSSAPGHVTLSLMSNALLNRLRLNSSANVWCLYVNTLDELLKLTRRPPEAHTRTHTCARAQCCDSSPVSHPFMHPLASAPLIYIPRPIAASLVRRRGSSWPRLGSDRRFLCPCHRRRRASSAPSHPTFPC